jgi:hypothetical protein
MENNMQMVVYNPNLLNTSTNLDYMQMVVYNPNLLNTSNTSTNRVTFRIYHSTFYQIYRSNLHIIFSTCDELEEKVKAVTFIDRCCICLEDSDCMTECGHELCKTCIKKVKKCPMCREELFHYYVNKSIISLLCK